MKKPLKNSPFKKNAGKLLLAGVLLASLFAAGGAGASPDPIKNYRRTLFMSVGQHLVVFEAPVGMCFLDKSDYLEGTVARTLKGDARKDGARVISTFYDCLEIAKIQESFQAQAVAAAKNGGKGGSPEPGGRLGELKNGGRILWLNPNNPDSDEQVVLSRDKYLDLREKDFRTEVIKNNDHSGAGDPSATGDHSKTKDDDRDHAAVKSEGGDFYVASLDPPGGQFVFDEKTHRTPDGISLAFSEDNEVEYQKQHTAEIVGTTLLHQVPVEVDISYTTKTPDKDFKALYTQMDSFLAQNVQMNNKYK